MTNKAKLVEQIESRFPSMLEATNFIDKLSVLDLSKISIHELTDLIDSIFHTIPITFGEIEKGTILYRARINRDKKHFDKVSKIGLPPVDPDGDFGRANLPGERVFYSSDTPKLACTEVLKDKKFSLNPSMEMAIVTVSYWEVTQNLNVATLFYSPVVAQFRADIAKFKEENQEALRTDKIIKESVVNVQELILEYFCDEFAKSVINSPHDYKISAFYSKRVQQANSLIASKYSEHRFDGLLYPSVARKFEGNNIALFDDNLTRKITLKTAFEMVCSNFDFNKPDFKSYYLHKVKEIKEGGEIIWNEKAVRAEDL